jgi:O-Antigen ligase
MTSLTPGSPSYLFPAVWAAAGGTVESIYSRLLRRIVLVVVFGTLSYGFFLIPVSIDEQLQFLRLPDLAFIVLVMWAIARLLKSTATRRMVLHDSIAWSCVAMAILTTIETVYTIGRYPGQLIRDTLALSANYWYYLLYVPFRLLWERPLWRKALRDVACMVVACVSVLFVVQVTTGLEIFALEGRDFQFRGREVSRSIAGITPFTYFVVFYAYERFRQGVLGGFVLWFLLPFAVCIISMTRGVIIVMLLVLLWLTLRRSQGRRGARPLIAVFTAMLLAAAAVGGDIVRERLFSSISEWKVQEGTAFFRWTLLFDRWNLALRENPVLGVGFLHAKTGVDLGLTRGYVYERTINVWVGDNSFATIVAQLGLVGLLLVALFSGVVIRAATKVMRRVRTSSAEVTAVTTALWAACLTLIILGVESGTFVDRPWPILLYAAWVAALSEAAPGVSGCGEV